MPVFAQLTAEIGKAPDLCVFTLPLDRLGWGRDPYCPDKDKLRFWGVLGTPRQHHLLQDRPPLQDANSGRQVIHRQWLLFGRALQDAGEQDEIKCVFLRNRRG